MTPHADLNALALAGAFVFWAGCGLATPPASAAPRAPVRVLIEPDAGPQAVLSLISSARQSVWAEMYLLTDGGAIAALAGRAAAGCDVRVLLEPAPYQAETANQSAFGRLAAAGADVRWSTPRFTYTHAKMLLVDHAALAVLTLNLTASGLGGNREYGAVDTDAADVAAAEALFAADQLGASAGPPGGRLVTSPESSRPALLALFAGARDTLAIETEELADEGAVEALLAARARGVAVTLAWPGPAARAPATIRTLADAGVAVRAVDAPPIHGKVVVADGRHVYLGSANLTATSLDANREVGLALDDAALGARLATTVAADAAGGLPP
ncbi:MAG TPA: phospholipase D-like domain-containing protein [Polyangia bacterium]|nr:phospholipase D-like domain-containing protein [Polyangia bacterium]